MPRYKGVWVLEQLFTRTCSTTFLDTSPMTSSAMCSPRTKCGRWTLAPSQLLFADPSIKFNTCVELDTSSADTVRRDDDVWVEPSGPRAMANTLTLSTREHYAVAGRMFLFFRPISPWVRESFPFCGSALESVVLITKGSSNKWADFSYVDSMSLRVLGRWFGIFWRKFAWASALKS